MNLMIALEQGLYGAVVVWAFLVCASGIFGIIALIASLFGRLFGRLDNGGDK